jgi:hypothetical protein
LSAAKTLGVAPQKKRSTLKGLSRTSLTLSGLNAIFYDRIPWLSLRSNHGLPLANAFGVLFKSHHETPVARSTRIFQAHIFIVCDYDFPQRSLAVLDSTNNREDAVAPTGWNTGGVEYLHAVFSASAAGGILIRAGYNFVDGGAQAGGVAHRPPAAVVSLLAAYAHR